MKLLRLLALAALLPSQVLHATSNTPAPPQKVKLQLVTDQVLSPVAMAVPGDGSNRQFVCQKEGRVWIIRNGKLQPQPFLDVSAEMVKINPGYDERGLLGIAFHPRFKSNGKFYLYYSVPSSTKGSNHKSLVAEYKVSSANPDLADKDSKRTVMEIEQPESNHNGGDLAFGPDNYLYISLGDGGGAGDRHGATGNGQNMDTWLGKILRIDVNGTPYSVPKDNPFVNKPGIKPEIWAYGLRNAWRMSFDKGTKRLFAGDVGQNKYEEVDIITKGGNYGWRIMEGYHGFRESEGDKTKLIEPIHEYDHDQGISITGGYVYRGNAIPALRGQYVFGDYNGKSWTLVPAGAKWTGQELELVGKPANMQILSWGQDEAGELYVLVSIPAGANPKGAVYKLVKA
ncbi:PQQ-dependent sugar dehydrogenase [uncultured Chitinophaga sp.]|uniref:PQQ-dependent sugar dehydrogenase n=1 Tax=uncultured Chitinophaga sp. TaxID=339340 RepID=UPI0025E0391E|nr:PQQ-dependent sugar dehydrogenase [uncultured Chitinophaga sp.]